ncbi:hypothetical protein EUX98_g6673 [Antrodiella citrinella]|uniref:Peptidase metallopeptidase domain-containing protein n=1 Tax=Antrodiella citrinella TaxID=2447956 RepID=A0A4S4MQX5_9APHY|nr:hypothetical protein EUX98_g6673 [Antrodiella citrinella]
MSSSSPVPDLPGTQTGLEPKGQPCLDRFPKAAQLSAGDRRDLNALQITSTTRLSLLWDNGTEITYGFMEGTENGNDTRRNTVNSSIEKTGWTKYANIKFRMVELSEKPQIRIRFTSQLSNSSFVGKENLSVPMHEPTMNLAFISGAPASKEDQEYQEYVISHQFGHVLGLSHENADFPKYDDQSLMRFPHDKEEVLRHERLLLRRSLTDTDRAWLVINYPRTEVSVDPQSWSLEHALTIGGVPTEQRARMLTLPPHEVPKEYAMWLARQLHVTSPPEPPSPSPSAPVISEKKAPEWFQKTCAVLPDKKMTPTGTAVDHACFAVMAKAPVLWKNGSEITYSFVRGPFQGTNAQQQKVHDVIGEWSIYANVTFVRKSGEGKIRITFNKDIGSWSYVGTQCTTIKESEATMNLACVGVTDSAPDSEERGTILHEFGHVLGMMHEHQSPIRGGTLTLREEAVYNFYMNGQGWSRELVKQQIVDVYNTRDVSNFSKFDSKSIMMYFMPPDMNEQRINVPPNYSLTDLDKAFVVINYPRKEPAQEAPEWTLAHALDVVGVDASAKANILARTDDADDVRLAFTLWTAANHALEHHPTTPSHAPHSGKLPTAPAYSATKPAPHPVPKDEDKRDWCATGRSSTPGGGIGADPYGPAHAVTVVNASLWLPGDSIKYWYQQKLYQGPIVDGLFEPRINRVERLESVFKEYEAVVNVKFVEAKSEADSDVRIWFKESDGVQERSWCWIAKDSKDSSKKNDPSICGGNERTTMYLNLPRSDPQSKNKVKTEERLNRTCRHEVGHLLGLLHEHSSPKTKTVSKVDPTAAAWTDYDPKSIMLYPKIPLKNSEEEHKTGLVDQEVEMTERNVVLSDKDKAFLQALYPTSSEALDEALTVLGVSAKDKILEPYADAIARQTVDPSGYALCVTKMRAMLVSELHELSGPMQYGIGVKPSKHFGVAAPMRDVVKPKPRLTEGNFLSQIIGTLQQFFAPGGGQIFTLQFPGRFLQMSEYAWDTKSAGIYGQVVKPLVVNEGEFRLTDQLYDVAEVVSGPNGISLSQVYEQVLNNLLPAYRTNNLTKHQEKIRGWLMKDVQPTGWVQDLIAAQKSEQATSIMSPSRALAPPKKSSATGPKPAFAGASKLSGSTTSLSRMELSNALMQEYLEAKNAWEAERDKMLSKALKLRLGSDESAEALNDLTRELAHTTAAREAQLAAKYSDAVVRGYSHNVREYVGYLDVKSPAETLQEAKDSLRESSMSSFDGSLRVYPVQMGPIDWFEGLSTSFTLEDLTSDPVLIEQQIQAKAQQLDVLNGQLTALRFGTKGTVDELREKTARAQTSLDDAQAKLASKYTHNILAMAKTCFDKVGKLDETQLVSVAAKMEIATVVVDQLKADLTATSTAQQELTSASRAFSQASASLALAEATDTQQQQEQIKQTIRSITSDLNELTSRYTSLNSAGKRPTALAEDKLPSIDSVPLFTGSESSGGSRWQQIQMNHSVTSNYSKQSDSASAKASAHQCNLWLFSSGHSSSSSSASASSETASANNEVNIGFRATLVTVDRAGWFRPQFFKQSSTFYHIDEDISWSKWPAEIRTMPDLKAKNETTFPVLNEYLLPAFPVGYIICKDITIKIRNAAASDASSRSTMKEDAAASGGILCFSYSQSDSSSQSENSHAFQQCSDGCIIRIPGPQILGYIMQLTETDKTKPIPDDLPPDFLIVPEDEKPGPLHGLNVPPPVPYDPLVEQIQALLKQANVPKETLASVRDAVQNQLKDLVAK